MKHLLVSLAVLVILSVVAFAQVDTVSIQRDYLNQIEKTNQQVKALQDAILPGDTLVFTVPNVSGRGAGGPWGGAMQVYKLKLTPSQKSDLLDLINKFKSDIDDMKTKLKAITK